MGKESERQKYDAEFVVSSRGHYIFHCECGATTNGVLEEIPITKPYVYCGQAVVGFCDKSLNLRKVAEREDILGTRLKKILKLD